MNYDRHDNRNVAFVFTFTLIMITWPSKTLNARNFNKYWNQSLVFLEGSPIISMTMPVSALPCAVCYPIVAARNGCRITTLALFSFLISRPLALSPNPLAVSSIDSTLLNINIYYLLL